MKISGALAFATRKLFSGRNIMRISRLKTLMLAIAGAVIGASSIGIIFATNASAQEVLPTPAAPFKGQIGISAKDSIMAQSFCLDKNGRWAKQRELICALAGVDPDAFRDKALLFHCPRYRD